MSSCLWKLKLDNIFGLQRADLLQSASSVFISLHAAGLN